MNKIKIAMTLHHHSHSPLQKNLWCNNVGSLLFLNSLVYAPCRHPFWRGSLKRTSLISTATIIILHLFGCVIGGGGGGGWSRGVCSRRWHDFGVGVVILTHLLFFVGVAENDDIAVAGRS
jgi:hypothetical protein